uniref:Protein YIPF n=3 Tax=Felidae TaxID=9681 RepID=A0A8C8XUP2_PANLE
MEPLDSLWLVSLYLLLSGYLYTDLSHPTKEGGKENSTISNAETRFVCVYFILVSYEVYLFFLFRPLQNFFLIIGRRPAGWMAAVGDLQFEEFGNAAATAAENPGATTISIEGPGESPTHQAGLPRGSGGEEDDELLGNDDSDKTELLAGQKKSSPFWTFEYYQTFFDVDTYQVFDRIKGSLLPIPGKNFVRLYIRSNPDLYGPFWICATLVFAIAISGNLSNFLIHLGEKTYHYVPEFRKVSIAATIIYAYAWLVPLALWGFLMWRNSKVMNIVSYSFLEIVCVYGYSLFIYIPTAVLWIIPQKAVRWILVMIALGVSGSVLAMTFWPAVREDNRRIALATIVTIVLLHTLLSVGCLAYFFDAPEMDHLPTATAAPNQTVAAAKAS